MSEAVVDPSALLAVTPGFGVASRWLGGRQLLGGAAVALSDLTASQAALAAADLVLRGLGGEPRPAIWAPGIAGAVAAATLVSNSLLCLYDTIGRSPVERFRLRCYGALAMPVLALSLSALSKGPTLPLSQLLITAALFLVVSLILETTVRGRLIARSAWGAPAVVIGSGDGTGHLAAFLLAHPDFGIRPVAVCGDAGKYKFGRHVPRFDTLGDLDRVPRLANIAVVSLEPGMAPVDLTDLPFARVIAVPQMAGVPALWLRASSLGALPAFNFTNTTQVMASHPVKRATDLLIAVPMLVLALPLLAVCAVLIKSVSPGPVLYRHCRIGLGGAPMTMLKLRTMHTDAERRLDTLLRDSSVLREQWATKVKLSPDPRIIPMVGIWMRRLSIDELPQLWNVIRGEMSLVGPRPFPAYHHNRFGSEFQRLRTSVRPGLTGLWQVSARSDADLQQQERIDTLYIRNWSLWLDLWVVLLTFPAVLNAQGAR